MRKRCDCVTCKCILKCIGKCAKEMVDMENGNYKMPPGVKDSQEDLLHSLMEGRYEHLENFQSTLIHLYVRADKGMIV